MKRKTILVVEDETVLRHLAVKILERAGHLVLSAENADEAREVWRVVGRGIDLLVTDIVMPGLDGIQMAEEFREARPELKIIFMTGSVDREVEIATLGDQTEIVSKPYTPDTLIKAVKRMFEDEEYEI